jgi:plasmid stabilization system protein ParE
VVIVWSKPARKDLTLIHQYIAHDSKRYANRVVQDITDKVEVLLITPRLGRMVAEIGEENVREIAMYSYRIMYELMQDAIYIHGVFHKRRHFKPEDLQR